MAGGESQIDETVENEVNHVAANIRSGNESFAVGRSTRTVS